MGRDSDAGLEYDGRGISIDFFSVGDIAAIIQNDDVGFRRNRAGDYSNHFRAPGRKRPQRRVVPRSGRGGWRKNGAVLLHKKTGRFVGGPFSLHAIADGERSITIRRVLMINATHERSACFGALSHHAANTRRCLGVVAVDIRAIYQPYRGTRRPTRGARTFNADGQPGQHRN